ncbi:RcpC/CpaB family pilus assembly protein [Basilea psittacipulmonis]|uniref:SAF domain-containing protein n=1 Tax=Basilea psittacipulmonis DSM 24701 TaxID=1072685 RepID=A0A077DGR0_9BURK|nr:hypothetical protein [Basilea psittacipulmonis]AIL32358.1 hypothetical protein IX83_02635 [Basilea psittacipulmonis DSM 24701]
MNYRTLFVISFVILAVAVAGLLLMPSFGDDSSSETVSQDSKPVVEEKVTSSSESRETVPIKRVIANYNLFQGDIIQPDDFRIEEADVDKDSPEIQDDISAVLSQAPNGSIQGFLVTTNIDGGTVVPVDALISPDDPNFLRKTIDKTKEVAYQFCVPPQESFVLDTLDNGSKVDVYVTAGMNPDSQPFFHKVLGGIDVLRINYTQAENEETKEQPACVATVRLRMTPKQIRDLYVTPGSKVLLPFDEQIPAVNRGRAVRALRGG